jgi:ribose transport system substrate-binding protein
MKRSVLLAALTCFLVTACSGGGTPARPTIAVIPKGTSHVFWQSIHAGAIKAGGELNVDIAWRGPLREDDRDAQVAEVENAVGRGVAGIVVAPLDDAALVAPVSAAMRRKIPVAIIDSGLKGDDYISFVATDNEKGGRLGGEKLATLLGGKGRVIMLRYAEGSDSTTKREEGFLSAIKSQPGIEIVSSNQYAGADVEGAYKKSEAILSQLKKPDGSLSIDGIFCPNESSTFGMLRVLEDNGWAGKVKFVGFDASPNLVKALEDGRIDALVVQNPFQMGYLGVKTVVGFIKGEKVERKVDTGVQVVGHDETSKPDVKEFLHPDLDRWLKK